MEAFYPPILLGAGLVALSIVAGMFSSRIGVPLLLVFLGLGMLAGEDGPGGIAFNDFRATFMVGSMALAIILFDGGLRTPRAVFRLAMWPALGLATIGVLLTSAFAAAFAVHALQLSWLQALLLGATVASTDAAAVFLLLHLRGTELKKRVSATLEIESGINDPMAVFLTILCVELLLHPDLSMSWHVAASFLMQLVGGLVIGFAGGFALLWIINRVEIAPGQYPIFAAAFALAIFSGAQMIEASGFLAVYLAGLVLGNRRHRAQAVISRFHDGLAWLAQIVMFLMLGLLATPSTMVQNLWGELVVAAGLILIARPLAVCLSLAPFRFSWQELAFISWVGLRGAVPIFLASIPVIAGVPNGMVYFNVAFVVVITSLVVQGWTVGHSARLLGLEVPPPPEPIERREIELPPSADREAASWRVAPSSPAIDLPFNDLPLPKRTRVIAVIREGTVMNRETLERLLADDYVIALAPPEHVITLDKLFSTRPPPRRRRAAASLGDFVIDGKATLGDLELHYGVAVADHDRARALADLVHARFPAGVAIGDRVRLGQVELIVHALEKGHVARIGLELEPGGRLPLQRLMRRLRPRRGEK